MHPDHRAQLAAAIARFLADIRRLAREVRPQERDRLLTALDPKRARSAASPTAGTSGRAAAATRRQPAARTRRAAAGAGARQATRRGRKTDAAGKRHAAPGVADSASTTAATTTETSGAPAMTDRPATEAATAARGPAEPAAGAAAGTQEDQARWEQQQSTSSTEPTATRGPAAGEATPAGPASGQSGGKRMQWTREAIIDELARWMVTGTAIDASFLKRNGPPGLVPAAIRVFGRFDAALNVAGLHVAKLYPADAPAPDGVDARRPRRPPGRRWSSASNTRA